MTQTASTGTNDPTSVYGSGLLNFANALTNTANNVVGVVKNIKSGNSPRADQPQANQGDAATAANPFGKYLPWIIGGAVLLVVVVMLRRK